MNEEHLSAIVSELASRPRHNKVGSLIYTLLTSGLESLTRNSFKRCNALRCGV